MAERNIAAEVLKGLREVQEHQAGRRTLRTTRVEMKEITLSNVATAHLAKHGIAKGFGIKKPAKPE